MEHRGRKLPKVIDHADVLKMLDGCNTKSITGLRNYVILLLMWRCGLRISEVSNLMLDDVDLEKGSIYVQLGKGKVDRYVYIDFTVKEWLAKWLAVRPKSDWLICRIKGGLGEQLHTRMIRDVVYRLSEKAGVYIRNGRKKVKIHPHTLRHTFATEMLEDGFTLEEIRDQMGHGSISTTSIYVHVRDERLAKKMAGRGI